MLTSLTTSLTRLDLAGVCALRVNTDFQRSLNHTDFYIMTRSSLKQGGINSIVLHWRAKKSSFVAVYLHRLTILKSYNKLMHSFPLLSRDQRPAFLVVTKDLKLRQTFLLIQVMRFLQVLSHRARGSGGGRGAHDSHRQFGGCHTLRF